MAIFVPGGPVGAISGTVGGQNFVVSSQGFIMRKAQRAPSAKSEEQLKRQSFFNGYLRNWSFVFDDETRLLWESAAKQITKSNRLGTPRRLTGRQLYLQQYALQDAFADGIQVPGTMLPASTVVDPGFLAEEGGPFTWSTTFNTETFLGPVNAYFARPFTQAPVNTATRWLRSTQFTFAPTISTSVNLFSGFEDKWGSPAAGERIGFRFTIGGFGNRLVGPPQTLFVTVQP